MCPTRGIKHWGLSGYLSVLPRIKFCGVLTVLCSEIRHCAKHQTVGLILKT